MVYQTHSLDSEQMSVVKIESDDLGRSDNTWLCQDRAQSSREGHPAQPTSHFRESIS